MTKLLEQAFAQASALPVDQQNAIANWLIEEIESERLWDESFAKSQDLLAEMGAKALEEHRRGETEDMEYDAP